MDSLQDIQNNIETVQENTDITHSDDDPAMTIDEKCDIEEPTFGFTEKSWRTDFILLVEGKRLYVNKAILSLASPVFDTMFQSDFKESQCEELELPGKRYRDVIEFLRCIYPNNIPTNITMESAVTILPLIEEYQVVKLKPRCEQAIIENIGDEIQVEKIFGLLHTACLYNLVDLRKLCVKITCTKSEKEIDEAFQNCQPPAEAAKEILEQLNKKLRETVNKQKLLIDDISREATENTATLKAANTEQERQLVILKQYLSADVKTNKTITLGYESQWRECIAIFDVDMGSERVRTERQVTVWNVPLVVVVSEKSTAKNKFYLGIEIRCINKEVVCSFKGRVVVVNRQPMGENHTVLISGSFSNCSIFSSLTCSQEIMKMSRIKEIANGFLSNGRIGVIVQIFMTEPNRG
ncbi:uncharacterized protein LOC132733201 [Ruditapes philippinarum]|uniref:uncharacterized protein LOC132733201 n=1 Tax=Ruditapes philippinarum TaxID=129788 RepID=UPI00295B43F7|nr:uncharacterized protein LOC132733201 [Ruditapes philippinarum]